MKRLVRELRLQAFAIGDVLDGTDEADLPARIVEDHPSLLVQRALGAVGQPHPVIDAKRAALGHRAMHCFVDGRAVFGMHGEQECSERWAERLGSSTKDSIGFVGPNLVARDQIPLPTPEAGDLLCLGEFSLTVPPFRLGPPAKPGGALE